MFGSIPAVALYLAVTALGATSSEAAFTALFRLVASLFTMGRLGASASGAHRRLRAVVEVVGAGLIAVLLVIMKALLH